MIHGLARTPLVTILAGSILALAGARAVGADPGIGNTSESGEAGPEAVLARWNGGTITRGDLDAWRAASGGEAEHGVDSETEDLRHLALLRSLAADAEAEGLDEEVQVRLRLETVRQRILIPELKRTVVAAVTVSDEEVEALRREHPEAFRRPAKVKLRNLYQRLGAGEEAAATRRRMEELHRQLAAGGDFEELAREHSQSQSAARGGALGFVDPEELPAAVAGVVRELRAGQLSAPVEHGEGISIFLCEEVRPAQLPTPGEVRTKLRRQLERLRAKEAWARFEAQLLAEAAPRIEPASPTVVLAFAGYRLEAAGLEALEKLQGLGRGDLASSPEQRDALLRRWALRVLAAARATELGMDRQPDTARALFWKRIEILAAAKLANLVQEALPRPTESELRAFHEAHRRQYREPAADRLRAIGFGKADGPDGQRILGLALTVERALREGELSFEEAARRHSQHPSAVDGGDMGWRPRTEIALWGPNASQTLRGLSVGETTPLLHLDAGLWLFRLEGRREARDLSFAEAESRVRHDWFTERLPALEAKIREDRLAEIGFESAPFSPPPRTIRWSTATEVESFGFDVYRGDGPEGPFQRVSEEPIAGAGTSDVPHHYRFEDPTAEPGRVYYYYVESISTSGQRRRLTPIRPSTGPPPGDRPATTEEQRLR